MELLEVGKVAPSFTLQNQKGDKVSLKDFKGEKYVVLYFYPKALTPGCTIQACGIRDAKRTFSANETVVLGISPDPVNKLERFNEKKSLNFDLLSDLEHKIADKYRAWGPKKFMGKSYDGIHRVTYIIGKDGKIKHVMARVKTKSHHDDILEIIRTFKSNAKST